MRTVDARPLSDDQLALEAAQIKRRLLGHWGTTTTPFDMAVRNDMDRFHLVMDVIDRVPGLAKRAAVLRQEMQDKRTLHRAYVNEVGADMPEIVDWAWST